MASSDNSWVLYTDYSVLPVICERDDWRECPEHKHLSDERPDIDMSKVDFPESDMSDAPDDNIVSVNEYGSSGKVEPSEGYWEATVGKSSEMNEARYNADSVGTVAGIAAAAVSTLGSVALFMFAPVPLAAAGGIGAILSLIFGGGIVSRFGRFVSKTIMKRKGKSFERKLKDDYRKTGVLPVKDRELNYPTLKEFSEQNGIEGRKAYDAFKYENSWEDFLPFSSRV